MPLYKLCFHYIRSLPLLMPRFLCSRLVSFAAAAVLPGPQQLGGVGAVRVHHRVYRPRALPLLGLPQPGGGGGGCVPGLVQLSPVSSKVYCTQPN